MYEIGQKIVCVKTHSQGVVKEGQLFVVKNLRLCVNCKVLDIDVGIRLESRMACSCGCVTFCQAWWLHHFLFKPLDELFNEEIAELMTEINEKAPFEL